MIREQLAGNPARWRWEMLCEWTEDTNTWLPTSLITMAQDNALDYLEATSQRRGEYYLGVDFGKHVDYSVVAALERLKGHLILRHLNRFPLETSYGAVIGYIKRLQEGWRTVRAIYADKTGVGDYIVEDMERSGLVNVTGVNFTDTSKEAMATCLRESMRTADCPLCGWRGHVEDLDGSWRTTCPKACSHEDGRPVGLRPLLHIPYDPDLYAEMNVERFELGKTGKLLFSHPEATNDDRFWSLALAVYATESAPQPASKPMAKIIA